MAINKTINKRTNTHGAMRNCIEYVLRQDKTNELFTCVTGPYCHDEINYDLVYRTFLEEAVDMNRENLDGETLSRFPLVQGEQIRWEN